MDFLEPLRNLSAMISIAHHIPGRIRLKLNAGLAQLRQMEAFGIESAALGGAIDALPGIRGVHLNKLARSITIEYDNESIPDHVWPDLLATQPSPEATALLNRLQNEYRRTLETTSRR